MLKSAEYFLRGGSALRDGNMVVVDEFDPFREDFRTNDPQAFELEAKRRGMNLRHLRALASFGKDHPYRPNLTPHPKAPKAPSLKNEGREFAPAAGEIGAWVTWTGRGTAQFSGQVWAISPHGTGKFPRVWVVDATGAAYDIGVSELTLTHAPNQLQLT